MLAKKYRLSHQDFQKFSDRGFYQQNDYFKFFICPNQLNFSRWAIVVGAHWSKSSVERHKIKRQLMNLIKDKKELLNLPYDIAIWPKPILKEKDFQFIKEKFEKAVASFFNQKNGPNP